MKYDVTLRVSSAASTTPSTLAIADIQGYLEHIQPLPLARPLPGPLKQSTTTVLSTVEMDFDALLQSPSVVKKPLLQAE